MNTINKALLLSTTTLGSTQGMFHVRWNVTAASLHRPPFPRRLKKQLVIEYKSTGTYHYCYVTFPRMKRHIITHYHRRRRRHQQSR
jgi:hypothetical protein